MKHFYNILINVNAIFVKSLIEILWRKLFNIWKNIASYSALMRQNCQSPIAFFYGRVHFYLVYFDICGRTFGDLATLLKLCCAYSVEGVNLDSWSSSSRESSPMGPRTYTGRETREETEGGEMGEYQRWASHMDQISIKTPNPKCRLYWC